MSGIRLNGRAYGGVATVSDATRLMCEDGSGNIVNAQVMLENILGDIATLQQSDTASKAYTTGDYLILNGYFYKVIDDISQGGTITPETNVVKTDVGSEFKHRVLWYDNQTINNTEGTQDTLLEITDPAITADHIADKFVAANPSVITSDITCTTIPGKATLTGTSTAGTTASIMLIKKDN